MSRFLLAACFLLAVPSTGAPSAKAQAIERIIGLVDVRGIEVVSPDTKAQTKPARREGVKLRRAASDRAPVAEIVDSIEMLETEYRDKFTRAAKVYDSNNGWFLVGWKKGRGWLAPESAGTFYPLEKMVGGGLTYLTPHWDGRLWTQSPLQGTPLKLVRSDSTKNVRVVETRRIGDEPWFLVEILTSHGCDAETPVKKHEGWVPLYAKSGHTTLWFQARGCGAG